MKTHNGRLWQTEDLPLFSGSTPTVRAQPFTPTEATTQQHIGNCPICYDTGTVMIKGKTRPCICKKGQGQ